jgi:hypothetical protein
VATATAENCLHIKGGNTSKWISSQMKLRLSLPSWEVSSAYTWKIYKYQHS